MKQVINVNDSPNLNIDRNEYVARYYNDVKRFPILTKDEEQNLFKIIKGDNPKLALIARNKLIECNQRFVISIAKRFATSNNFLDLIEEGNIGLINCINSFDPSTNYKFITWAVWFIRRSIIFYCVNSSLIKRPNINKTYHAISEASNKFMQSNERFPSDDELIDIINKEYDLNLTNLSDVTKTSISYIDSTENNENDIMGENFIEFNNKSSSYNYYEDEMEHDFNKENVKQLLTLLNNKEREIMCLLYGIGYDREYSMQEIAWKLNLTTERIRQINYSSLTKLKCRYARMSLKK